MCRSIFIKATTDDGVTPHPEAPSEVHFGDLDDALEETFPTCTCWIGDAANDSIELRRILMEKYLRPYLDKVRWGNIIIEVR